jgi:hypothetical protein
MPQRPPNKPKPPWKKRKWSLIETWNRASWAKRIGWAGAIVGTAFGGWKWFVSEQHYGEEHRPKVVLDKPPLLAGTIQCYITDRQAIHFNTEKCRSS